MKWLLPRPKSSFRRRADKTRPNPRRWANHKFDESTGQIYTETTVPLQTSDDRGWDRKTRLLVGPSKEDSEQFAEYLRSWQQDQGNLRMDQKSLEDGKGLKRPPGGARTLEDSAIECVLQNLSDITVEGIECLPSHIVRRLWYTINKRCTACFNTWSIFTKILRDCDILTLDLLRYRQVIKSPRSPLFVYTAALTSNSFDFITSLSITTTFSVPDLVRLSKIINLGVLEIIASGETSHDISHSVTDRIVREWHHASLNEGAFKVLRILKLWNHKELTCSSLSHVTSFPALAIYDVRGCAVGSEAYIRAQDLGWKLAVDLAYLDHLDGLCRDQINKDRQSSRPLGDGNIVTRTARNQRDIAVTTRHSRILPDISVTLDRPGTRRKRQLKSRIHSKHWPSSEIKTKTWDFETSSAFNRIGDLRNDQDLSRAGIDIGDQAFVSDQVVNSVPMVSLRLGLTPSSLKPRGFTFIRIEAPSQVDLKNLQPSTLNETSEKPNISQKQQRHGVMRAKKRKLNDVLGSFL